MIRKLNENRKEDVLKMMNTYKKYIKRCKDILNSIESNWDGFSEFIETTDGSKEYYDDIDNAIYEISKAFTELNRLDTTIYNVMGKETPKVWESKNRSRKRSIKEADASTKTNYAVQVRNMGSGYVSLLTGTKAQCFELIDELENLESAYTEYDDDYASEANEEFIEYILPKYDYVEEINWREIDNRNNYYDHNTGRTYHIINDTFYDVYF